VGKKVWTSKLIVKGNVENNRLYSVEGTGGGAGLVELIELMTLIVYKERTDKVY
jgi:hypothetical protein